MKRMVNFSTVSLSLLRTIFLIYYFPKNLCYEMWFHLYWSECDLTIRKYSDELLKAARNSFIYLFICLYANSVPCSIICCCLFLTCMYIVGCSYVCCVFFLSHFCFVASFLLPFFAHAPSFCDPCMCISQFFFSLLNM